MLSHLSSRLSIDVQMIAGFRGSSKAALRAAVSGLLALRAAGCLFSGALVGKRLAESKRPQRERAVLLLNGPSISDDLQVLRNLNLEKLVVTNYFPETELFGTLKPTDLFLQDDFWFDRKLYGHREAMTLDRISKVNWDITVWVPDKRVGCETLRVLAKNPRVSVLGLPSRCPPRFLTVYELDLFRPLSVFRLWDLGVWAPPPESVATTALFHLLRTGFRDIEIFGLDMSMHEELQVSPAGALTREPMHFYGAGTSQPNWHEPTTVAQWFLSLWRKHKLLEILSGYALFLGANVVNRSSRTFSDAFRRF